MILNSQIIHISSGKTVALGFTGKCVMKCLFLDGGNRFLTSFDVCFLSLLSNVALRRHHLAWTPETKGARHGILKYHDVLCMSALKEFVCVDDTATHIHTHVYGYIEAILRCSLPILYDTSKTSQKQLYSLHIIPLQVYVKTMAEEKFSSIDTLGKQQIVWT